jgi:hypothetical protein
MRQYKPKSAVVAALRKSTLLDVTEDGKRVSRKVPLSLPNVFDRNLPNDDGDDIAYDPRTNNQLALPLKPIPQVKKERLAEQPKSSMKPTGFGK